MTVFNLDVGASGFDLQSTTGGTPAPIIAAVVIGGWDGEVESAPPAPVVAATVVGAWAGEVESAPPAPVIAATATGDWAGEVESVPSVNGTIGGVVTGEWAGEIEPAPPPVIALIDATLTADWTGEIQSAVPDNESGVIEDTFMGVVRLHPAIFLGGSIAETLGWLELPYQDSETESFQSRVSVTETFRGAHIEDRGVYDAGREMSFTVDPATRQQTEYANYLYATREVYVAHWTGYYLCVVDRVSTINRKLEIDLIIKEKLVKSAA